MFLVNENDFIIRNGKVCEYGWGVGVEGHSMWKEQTSGQKKKSTGMDGHPSEGGEQNSLVKSEYL